MKVAVRRLVAAAVPVLMLGVAGCSVHEQTQRWYPADNGVNAEAGDIGLRNVQVISDGDGRATVVAALANRGDADELIEILIGDVAADLVDGPVELPVGSTTHVGPDADRADAFDIEADPGRIVLVEFRFDNAPYTTVEALVRPAEGGYAEALPAEPEPEPEPTLQPTVEPAETPTPAPTD